MSNLGRPKLPTGSAMVSEAPCSEVTMGNTYSAGVSSLPNDKRMLLEEKECN